MSQCKTRDGAINYRCWILRLSTSISSKSRRRYLISFFGQRQSRYWRVWSVMRAFKLYWDGGRSDRWDPNSWVPAGWCDRTHVQGQELQHCGRLGSTNPTLRQESIRHDAIQWSNYRDSTGGRIKVFMFPAYAGLWQSDHAFMLGFKKKRVHKRSHSGVALRQTDCVESGDRVL